jgi:hypothetical protein
MGEMMQLFCLMLEQNPKGMTEYSPTAQPGVDGDDKIEPRGNGY